MTEKQKYVAIGDIHGCVKSMRKMLEKLEPFYDRTFIFMGDYIDRGPNSKQVVEELLDFQKQVDCVFLRGNHEQMLLNAVHEDEIDLWIVNGGRSTLQSYGLKNIGGEELAIPAEHMAFYEQTKLYYDTPDYFFVHAGLNASKTVEQNIADGDADIFLWERSHLNAFETMWEKNVVFGHTPRPAPLKKGKMIGIDTGCVYDRIGYGKLTAVRLPEQEFEQQICVDN